MTNGNAGWPVCVSKVNLIKSYCAEEFGHNCFAENMFNLNQKIICTVLFHATKFFFPFFNDDKIKITINRRRNAFICSSWCDCKSNWNKPGNLQLRLEKTA